MWMLTLASVVLQAVIEEWLEKSDVSPLTVSCMLQLLSRSFNGGG